MMEYMRLHLPNTVKWDGETLTDRFGTMTITALERGFGRTLGNALRRVMLSSLEGAAPVSVTIKGAEHEFSVLNGVLEDVPDIILNIKSLAVQYSGEGSARLLLKADKPGLYTAEAFECDEGVVVANPDQVIAEITEEGADLEIIVNIEQGKGFVTQDDWYNTGRGREIGDILLDSWFCPVKKVNFQVESARVGDRTDYDKLIMDVETDGSMTPAEAVENATGILMKHFELITGITVDHGEEQDQVSEIIAKATPEKPQDTPEQPLQEDIDLTDTDLSPRYQKILSAGGITTVNQLAKKNAEELLELRNFGAASLDVVRELLKSFGRSLAE
jgi:DNA-directed RNA polymerase subunit alpha